MTIDSKLVAELNALPKDMKEEVLLFIEFLKQKKKKATEIKERKFGYAKGFFEMKDNFDEPLEDFKEYM